MPASPPLHSAPRQLAPETTLVDTPRFLLATRDTGYRSAAAALSELIDNSLQAGARHIQVSLVTFGDHAEPPTAAVLDDGGGMSPRDLRFALQFGGSARFGDRSGLGRFGMGLPSSSLSQARRVDVYSWSRPGDVHHASLDLDEALNGGTLHLAAVATRLPEWVGDAPSATGTLVVWSRCDRLAGQRIGRLATNLREELGRIYRYALWDGVALVVNGDVVHPRDPLFLRRGQDKVRGRAYGTTLRYEVRVPGTDRTSVVRVRFSELPVQEWKDKPAEQRRASGIVRGAGVSVVRAGREIDYGWHLLGDKRRENYDDWWRCEIAFDPPLDELFGVTHSKQGVRPSGELTALLAPDIEATARLLNRRVRDSFAASAGAEPSRAERQAKRREKTLPPAELTPAANGDGTRFDYRIDSRDLASGDFFRVDHTDGVRLLVLNRLHPFYDRVYRLLGDDNPSRFALECLLLAAARAFDLDPDAQEAGVAGALRTKWSDALAAYLT
jgi:hypothetical protein